MPLPESYPRGVVFIGHRSDDRGRIVGTGFFVSIQGMILQPTYVVTAAHVVEGATETFVRVRTTDGPRDIDIPDWVFHGVHDVAVAPISVPFDHDVATTGIEQFIDDPEALSPPWGGIEVGDIVYFIGLLGNVAAMRDRLVPIVRAGVLGASWQEEVPVKRSPIDATKHITAHLIDCRSFGGFSGAPCYLQKSRVIFRDGGVTTEYRTLLLGLIGGHFDDWLPTKQREGIAGDDEDAQFEGGGTYSVSNDIQAPVSTGVGYVIPAEYIRETLMRDELVQQREADVIPLEE